MTHDPAAYSRALLTAAVAVADTLTNLRDSGASFNIATVMSAATPHLAPGWAPSMEDQGAAYAIAVGLCSAASAPTLAHLRAAIG
jgi:hypothetical protein